MKTYQAELLLDCRCTLAECPVYDEAQHGLYWLDIEENRIWYLELTTGRYRYTQLDRKIGSMVLTDRGRILAAMDDGVYLIDGLSCTAYCRIPESFGEHIRFNDGKCDPWGRFVAGTTASPNHAGLGGLFSVSGKDRYEMLFPGLGCSNGLAWSLDGKTMFHVDTLVQTPSYISASDYDRETGRIQNRREALDFSREAAKGHLADGMAMDREGNLWIAQWHGYAVGCWNPKTGEKLAEVSVPAAKVSSCAFGGPDYDTLFITTAAGDGRYSGGIFQVKLETAGLPAVKFRE